MNVERIAKMTPEDNRLIFPTVGLQIAFRSGWEKYYGRDMSIRPRHSGMGMAATSSIASSRQRSPQTPQTLKLVDILACNEGRRLKTIYRNRGRFVKANKQDLVALIIQYAKDKELPLACRVIDRLTEEIQEVFPNEEKVMSNLAFLLIVFFLFPNLVIFIKKKTLNYNCRNTTTKSIGSERRSTMEALCILLITTALERQKDKENARGQTVTRMNRKKP